LSPFDRDSCKILFLIIAYKKAICTAFAPENAKITSKIIEIEQRACLAGLNPIKHGLVQKVDGWPHATFHR